MEFHITLCLVLKGPTRYQSARGGVPYLRTYAVRVRVRVLYRTALYRTYPYTLKNFNEFVAPRYLDVPRHGLQRTAS